ncbi:MAG: IPT/TIG domain-containing protein [Candidatus Acidiferrales bacterium]
MADYDSILCCSLRRRLCSLLALLFLSVGIASCGGGSGSGGGQQPPPPLPDFSLSASPGSVSIATGSSATTSLNAKAINGFASEVSVQVSGLPAGVTASPTPITLTPGTPLTVTLSASSNAQPTATAANVVFTGTAGALVHTADVSVTVTSNSGGGGGGGTLTSRTKYVRDDAVIEYYQWVNTHWAVFNTATSRFFVTDPYSNQIFVFDSTTQSKIGAIPVPGAFGMDETPDQGTIWVGTIVGDVYSIDPVKMAVKQRYLASEIGPYGYPAWSTLVLSDGRLALLGAQGGIPGVDGSTSIAIWNPSNNSIVIYGNTFQSSIPSLPYCSTMENIGGFTLTADRTAILIGSIDSDGTVCKINATTGNLQSAEIASSTKIVVSPDGNYLLFPNYSSGVSLYNAKTFALVSQFSVSGELGSDASIVFSPDSKTLYVSSDAFVYAYSVATGQQIGWTPNIVVQYTSGGLAVGAITGPNLAAFDGTGLLAGPMEEGFGFIDTAAMHRGAVGTGFANAYLNPATGPTSGGTAVQVPVFPTETNQSKVYFGNNLAPSVSVSGNLATITTPAGAAGPVDVRLFANDGGLQLVPDGFSYGPSILEVSPNLATADGGGIGIVYGYGYGAADAVSIPANLAVTVGGKSAPVNGFNPNTYGLLSPPFLLQSVYYTIPPGTANSSVDIAVTSGSGSLTAASSLSYLPAAQQFPLVGASLAQGVYDPNQDLYYFTDATKIRVFSRTQAQWLSPLVDLSTKGAQRLWGLALSPDGTKLVAADILAGLIYLIDPANPASVKAFSFAPQEPQGILADPAGVVVTDSGVVYIAAYIQGGTGFSSFFKLDTNTSTLTDLQITGPGLATDEYLRTEISSDNSRVYLNDYGAVLSIDTSTGAVFQALSEDGCCYGNYDLALSHNQIQFAASDYLYDTDLNAESFETLNDRDANSGISYVYGSKLSPDGSLLFQPSTNGVDIFDGRLGTLRNRVALGFALSTNYDALVEDGKDNVLVAITGQNGNGVAILDFSSIREPPPLPYTSEEFTRPVGSGSPRQTMKGKSSIKKSKDSSPHRHVIPYITRPLPTIR